MATAALRANVRRPHARDTLGRLLGTNTDARTPVNPICERCGRRFCQCARAGHATKEREKPPDVPGPEECCQSTPQCEHCVWTVYHSEMAKFRARKSVDDDKGRPLKR